VTTALGRPCLAPASSARKTPRSSPARRSTSTTSPPGACGWPSCAAPTPPDPFIDRRRPRQPRRRRRLHGEDLSGGLAARSGGADGHADQKSRPTTRSARDGELRRRGRSRRRGPVRSRPSMRWRGDGRVRPARGRGRLEDALSDRIVIHRTRHQRLPNTWPASPTRPPSTPFALPPRGEGAVHPAAPHPSAMEPRGACALPAPSAGTHPVQRPPRSPTSSGSSGPDARDLRSQDPHRRPAVGGGFGAKSTLPEEVLCLALARNSRSRSGGRKSGPRTARPAPRPGAGPEHRVGGRRRGKVTAVRVRLIGDMGATVRLLTPAIPILGGSSHGVYDIPNYSFACTSSSPT